MIEQVHLERMKLVATKWFSEELAAEIACAPDIRLNQNFEWGCNDLAMQIRYKIAGKITAEEMATYPADWWEAFKDRWFSPWMKNRWPVRYKSVHITARELYPKMALPDRDGRIIIDRYDWGHSKQRIK